METIGNNFYNYIIDIIDTKIYRSKQIQKRRDRITFALLSLTAKP